MKIGIFGWKGNPENVLFMLNRYKKENMIFKYGGELKPFIFDYDLILVFGANPVKMIYLLFCSGKKIIRVCGSDWYKARFGKFLTRLFLKLFNYKIMYADKDLMNQIGLKGELLEMPVNCDLFYPRNIERDRDVLFYCPPGKEDIYLIDETVNDSFTILNGNTPYIEMPIVYSRHKKLIRNTLFDASPKMPVEALLCGCEVYVNGKKFKNIPNYMLSYYQIPKWINYIERIVSEK